MVVCQNNLTQPKNLLNSIIPVIHRGKIKKRLEYISCQRASKIWNTKVTVIPIAVCAFLYTVPYGHEKRSVEMEKKDCKNRLEYLEDYLKRVSVTQISINSTNKKCCETLQKVINK